MKSKEYTNGQITIVWKPTLCTHSGVCVRTLPNVYKPGERPWIRMEHASSQQLVMKAVEFARRQEVKIIPLCPFAARVFAKDPDIQGVKF